MAYSFLCHALSFSDIYICVCVVYYICVFSFVFPFTELTLILKKELGWKRWNGCWEVSFGLDASSGSLL